MKLAPCPFCEERNHLKVVTMQGSHPSENVEGDFELDIVKRYVECPSCGCRGPSEYPAFDWEGDYNWNWHWSEEKDVSINRLDEEEISFDDYVDLTGVGKLAVARCYFPESLRKLEEEKKETP